MESQSARAGEAHRDWMPCLIFPLSRVGDEVCGDNEVLSKIIQCIRNGMGHELFSLISSSMYLLLSPDYMERGEGTTEEEKENYTQG